MLQGPYLELGLGLSRNQFVKIKIHVGTSGWLSMFTLLNDCDYE